MINLRGMNSHVLLKKFKDALYKEITQGESSLSSIDIEEELQHRLRERSMLFLINDIVLHPAEDEMARESL